MIHTPDSHKAIDTLQTIHLKLHESAPLAYLCMPNVVLTLAGARGYADGVFYNSDENILENWKHEIEDVLDKLDQVLPIRYSVESGKNIAGKTYVSFDFISPANTAVIMKNYSFLTDEDSDKFIQQIDDNVNGFECLFEIVRKKSQFSKLSDIVVRDIAAGILLGYPEQAILTTAPLFEQEYEKYSDLGLMSASISQSDKFKCPAPVYEYPKSLANDATIIEHEKSWSKALDTFYSSKFFAELQDDLYFADKIESISK